MAIDKTKIFPGKKGKYIDIVLIDRKDDFGNDYLVIQDVTKEERAKGIRGAILGNGKISGGQGSQQSTNSSRGAAPEDDPRPPRQVDTDI